VKKGTSGQATIHVDAPSEQVYAMVSDVTRMGEWSPETYRCEWLDGATGPAVGARFRGRNRSSGLLRVPVRWSTTPRVTAADPGREFAFVTNALLGSSDMTKWTYRFEPAPGGGTEVTESFEMMQDLPWYIRLGELAMGQRDRKGMLEKAMGETLERIKKVAEAG
jgi:uncharacterized protein YndB with AHSA1/START domain